MPRSTYGTWSQWRRRRAKRLLIDGKAAEYMVSCHKCVTSIFQWEGHPAATNEWVRAHGLEPKYESFTDSALVKTAQAVAERRAG